MCDRRTINGPRWTGWTRDFSAMGVIADERRCLCCGQVQRRVREKSNADYARTLAMRGLPKAHLA